MKRRGYIGAWQQLRWAGQPLGPQKKYAYDRGQETAYSFLSHDAGFTHQPLPESLEMVRGYRTKTSQGTDYTHLYSVTFPLRLDQPETLDFGFVLTVKYDETTYKLNSYLAMMRMNVHAASFEEYNSENPNYGRWQTLSPWQILGSYNSRIYCWYIGEEEISNVTTNPLPNWYTNGIPISSILVDWLKGQGGEDAGLDIFEKIKTGTGNYWTRPYNGVYGTGHVFDQTVVNSGLTRVFKKTGATPYYTGNILNYTP